MHKGSGRINQTVNTEKLLPIRGYMPQTIQSYQELTYVTHPLPALCLARYLSLYCFFFFPNHVQLACCSCLVFSIAIHATRLETHNTIYCNINLQNISPQTQTTHHSCSSGDGMSPAVPFLVFSSFPCHQL